MTADELKAQFDTQFADQPQKAYMAKAAVDSLFTGLNQLTSMGIPFQLVPVDAVVGQQPVQRFPQMLHNPTGQHLIVQNEDDYDDAVKAGWSDQSFPTEDQEAVHAAAQGDPNLVGQKHGDAGDEHRSEISQERPDVGTGFTQDQLHGQGEGLYPYGHVPDGNVAVHDQPKVDPINPATVGADSKFSDAPDVLKQNASEVLENGAEGNAGQEAEGDPNEIKEGVLVPGTSPVPSTPLPEGAKPL